MWRRLEAAAVTAAATPIAASAEAAAPAAAATTATAVAAATTPATGAGVLRCGLELADTCCH